MGMAARASRLGRVVRPLLGGKSHRIGLPLRWAWPLANTAIPARARPPASPMSQLLVVKRAPHDLVTERSASHQPEQGNAKKLEGGQNENERAEMVSNFGLISPSSGPRPGTAKGSGGEKDKAPA